MAAPVGASPRDHHPPRPHRTAEADRRLARAAAGALGRRQQCRARSRDRRRPALRLATAAGASSRSCAPGSPAISTTKSATASPVSWCSARWRATRSRPTRRSRKTGPRCSASAAIPWRRCAKCCGWSGPRRGGRGSDFASAARGLAPARRRDLNWKCTVESLPPAWPMDARRHVFLFSKEALTNIVRHSHATRVEVAVQLEAGALALDIADHGVGFDPKNARRRPRPGRAARSGGGAPRDAHRRFRSGAGHAGATRRAGAGGAGHTRGFLKSFRSSC